MNEPAASELALRTTLGSRRRTDATNGSVATRSEYPADSPAPHRTRDVDLERLPVQREQTVGLERREVWSPNIAQQEPKEYSALANTTAHRGPEMQDNKTQSRQPGDAVPMSHQNSRQEWQLTEVESATLLELLEQPQPASEGLLAAHSR